MKVKELIEYLKTCDSEAKIMVEAPYHNGLINSKIIDMAIEPELDRLADCGDEIIIAIADYQIPID